MDGHYIGTDAKVPSATVSVVSQGETEVTLAYALYRSGDPLQPGGGQANVTFQLNNGKLRPARPDPAGAARAADEQEVDVRGRPPRGAPSSWWCGPTTTHHDERVVS